MVLRGSLCECGGRDEAANVDGGDANGGDCLCPTDSCAVGEAAVPSGRKSLPVDLSSVMRRWAREGERVVSGMMEFELGVWGVQCDRESRQSMERDAIGATGMGNVCVCEADADWGGKRIAPVR